LKVDKFVFVCNNGKRAILVSDLIPFFGWEDVWGNQSEVACRL